MSWKIVLVSFLLVLLVEIFVRFVERQKKRYPKYILISGSILSMQTGEEQKIQMELALKEEQEKIAYE